MKLISYAHHWFPTDVIRQAVWRYFRFMLSLRDIEDLMAERGINVSYDTIRGWTRKFGNLFVRNLGKLDRFPLAAGIWTRWWYGSLARECSCGALSMTKVKSSICWFRWARQGCSFEIAKKDLGYIDLEQKTLQPLDNPFGPGLSPMS
jgi:hypothetical protein